MTSKTQICQFAVSRCQVSQNISDLDERSVAADQCKLWYDHCRDVVLRSFPWSFALKLRKLAPVAGMEYLGYGAVYAMPEDCLYVKAITNASSVAGMQRGVGGLRWFWEEYGQRNYLASAAASFQIMQHDNGNTTVIGTNWNDAWAVYVSKSEITNLYTPDFVDALAWRLAHEIALPLQAKPETAANAWRMFDMKVREAWANALNEGGQQPTADSPSITCRG